MSTIVLPIALIVFTFGLLLSLLSGVTERFLHMSLWPKSLRPNDRFYDNGRTG